MAYEVFCRLGNGRVVNELYKRPENAIRRFTELSKKHKEVSLEKRRRSATLDSWRTAYADEGEHERCRQ